MTVAVLVENGGCRSRSLYKNLAFGPVEVPFQQMAPTMVFCLFPVFTYGYGEAR